MLGQIIIIFEGGQALGIEPLTGQQGVGPFSVEYLPF
jgi:hypothetical protein